MTALYLHIPFCRSKCHYCSFVSYPDQQPLHRRYVAALNRELLTTPHLGATRELHSVFFGGGTPTVLPSPDLITILTTCRQVFRFAGDCEISIEANPGTVDGPGLLSLQRAGLNRLSIGVQSFQAKELEFLGRCHSPLEAVAAVDLARKGGITNISIDLIYGLPGQNATIWRDNLQKALDLGVEHLSLYQLTLEENTPLARDYRNGKFSLPPEEEILEMDQLNQDLCHAAGLHQYEISNFAKPDRQCRHNTTYWQNEEYWAVGAGAVSYLDGRREQRLSQPLAYCQAVEEGRSTLLESEELDHEGQFRETVVMGLRMNRGISLNRITTRFALDPISYYGPSLEKLINAGFIAVDDGHLHLTNQGRLLANVVLAELV
jgi:oxygen-independent coproporphyrinogen III oxidase